MVKPSKSMDLNWNILTQICFPLRDTENDSLKNVIKNESVYVMPIIAKILLE